MRRDRAGPGGEPQDWPCCRMADRTVCRSSHSRLPTPVLTGSGSTGLFSAPRAMSREAPRTSCLHHRRTPHVAKDVLHRVVEAAGWGPNSLSEHFLSPEAAATGVRIPPSVVARCPTVRHATSPPTRSTPGHPRRVACLPEPLGHAPRDLAGALVGPRERPAPVPVGTHTPTDAGGVRRRRARPVRTGGLEPRGVRLPRRHCRALRAHVRTRPGWHGHRVPRARPDAEPGCRAQDGRVRGRRRRRRGRTAQGDRDGFPPPASQHPPALRRRRTQRQPVLRHAADPRGSSAPACDRAAGCRSARPCRCCTASPPACTMPTNTRCSTAT